MSPSAENAYAGIDNAARKRLFHAIIVSDVVRKLGMRVRPYEQEPGRTDAVIEEGIRNIVKAFETPDHTAPAALEKLVEEVRRIPVRAEKRPLVGIVGEIYVRSDPFINMQLYRRIEELGGEAWLAPIGEWILYTNECTRRVAKEEGKGWVPRLKGWIEGHWFHHVEQKYYAIADPVLHDRHEPPLVDVMEEGEKHLPWHFEGEALLTLGRAELFVKRDGASAVVNASPAFCMPGTVTTSIFPKMEKELGVPILCNFYDGSGDPNQGLVPMMHYLVEATRQKAAPA
jgi:predicted nucleotide-binding protein (sugar kinase/HSP70/actin superfamily)